MHLSRSIFVNFKTGPDDRVTLFPVKNDGSHFRTRVSQFLACEEVSLSSYALSMFLGLINSSWLRRSPAQFVTQKSFRLFYHRSRILSTQNRLRLSWPLFPVKNDGTRFRVLRLPVSGGAGVSPAQRKRAGCRHHRVLWRILFSDDPQELDEAERLACDSSGILARTLV
jgi:hypothetical protein